MNLQSIELILTYDTLDYMHDNIYYTMNKTTLDDGMYNRLCNVR